MIMNVQYLLQWPRFGKVLTFSELILVLYIQIYNANFLNNIVVVVTVRLYGLLIVIRKYVYRGERP